MSEVTVTHLSCLKMFPRVAQAHAERASKCKRVQNLNCITVTLTSWQL